MSDALFTAMYPDKVARLVRQLRNTPGEPTYDASTAWTGALDDPPQIWSLGGPAQRRARSEARPLSRL